VFSFLNKFQKRHTLPDPGADGATLQLFQYFPLFSVVGTGTVNQRQFAATVVSPPITLGARVTVPKEAPISGLGGVQDKVLPVQAPLYNPQTGVTGRNGL
jgi:hypothetical protein